MSLTEACNVEGYRIRLLRSGAEDGFDQQLNPMIEHSVRGYCLIIWFNVSLDEGYTSSLAQPHLVAS